MADRLGVPDSIPIRYTGPDADIVPIKRFPRRPLTTDKKFPTGQLALLSKNPSTGSQGELWYLAYFDGSGNAIWQQLTGTVVSGIAAIETDDGAPAVGPDGFGVVDLLGGTGIVTSGQDPSTQVTISVDTSVITTQYDADSGSATPSAGVLNLSGGTGLVTSATGNTVTFTVDLSGLPTVATTYTADSGSATPAANNLNVLGGAGIQTSGSGDTLTISLVGGGAAVLQFDVDANTPPGTDPVVPDGSGVVTISGAAVAAHSVPIETRSRAANAYNIEVQYAASAASSTATANGFCHFDTVDFTVDSVGFVTLNGSVMKCSEVTMDVNPMVANTWYTVDSTSPVTLTLPATASTCDFFGVIRKGSGAVSIAQQAGQTIHYNGVDTTTGAGGSLDSNAQWDVIWIKTVTANTDFVVISSSGAWSAT